MLSRKKESSPSFKNERNDVVALTYDMINTSTKLILLNFNNKNDNRIRGFETIRNKSNVFKSERNCHCLTERSPACACHHRDKNLSLSADRHKTCFDKSKTIENCPRPQTAHKSKKMNISPILPSSASNDKGQRIQSNKNRRRIRPNSSIRDVNIFRSMPYLSHPDLSISQQRMLFSLARIYTNIHNDINIKNHSIPKTDKQTFKKRLEKKKSRNQKSDDELGNKSVETAVSMYDEKDEEILIKDKLTKSEEDDEQIKKETLINNSSENEQTKKETYIKLVDDLIMNIIHYQAQLLEEESTEGSKINIPNVEEKMERNHNFFKKILSMDDERDNINTSNTIPKVKITQTFYEDTESRIHNNEDKHNQQENRLVTEI